MPIKAPAQRLMSPDGRSTLVAIGLERGGIFSDLYHSWLNAPWWQVLLGVIVLYGGANAIFAAGYYLTGGIENADGSFSDAFFFSVQTLATIGYGKLVPSSLPAHLLVTVESLCGLLGAAMAAGLMFAKFARPTARVLWSRVAVVGTMDGVPALMFRCANARGNQVVEATLRLGLLRYETTVEGQQLRRIIDLDLVRSNSPVFVLSWLAVHRIVPGSPLYGATVESLKASRTELYASLMGLDATFGQTIHTRHSWVPDEVIWDAQFVDIIGPLPDGRPGVDYSKFHETKPLAPRA
jgi:inward rectifier potassium channel